MYRYLHTNTHIEDTRILCMILATLRENWKRMFFDLARNKNGGWVRKEIRLASAICPATSNARKNEIVSIYTDREAKYNIRIIHS